MTSHSEDEFFQAIACTGTEGKYGLQRSSQHTHSKMYCKMNKLHKNTYRIGLCKVYVRYDGNGKQVLKAVYYRVWYGSERRVVDC